MPRLRHRPAANACVGPVAVRIFTIAGTRELETEGSVPRTTDLLNRTGDQLQVRESGGSGWEFLDIDELLVVVPPEQGSDRMRLHRPRQQVRVRSGRMWSKARRTCRRARRRHHSWCRSDTTSCR